MQLAGQSGVFVSGHSLSGRANCRIFMSVLVLLVCCFEPRVDPRSDAGPAGLKRGMPSPWSSGKGGSSTSSPSTDVSNIQVDPLVRAHLLDAYRDRPLSFEENRGQIDASARFFARRDGYNLLLTPTEAILILAGSGQIADSMKVRKELRDTKTLRRSAPSKLRLKFVGGNTLSGMEGLEELPGRANYLTGSDPSRWQINVPIYRKVLCRGIYPGIDLVYYGNDQRLPEYDFVLKPRAAVDSIRMEFDGATVLQTGRSGSLSLRIGSRQLRQNAPRAYQEADGIKHPVECRYILRGKNRVGFQLGSYAADKAVVIDPVLTYSTFLGGLGYDGGWDIAVDSQGSAYVAGGTNSLDFPLQNPFQSSFGGTGSDIVGGGDAFITKINATGTALIYSTYLGGSGTDRAEGIALDAAGSVYVTGYTESANFPLKNPYQPVLRGRSDAFVAKLSASGSRLIYSTYLGGSGLETTYSSHGDIAVDSGGFAYVTGSTSSDDFPVVRPIQAAFAGGTCTSADPLTCYDAFVAKLDAAGSALVYSTYLGGGREDIGTGIAVDASGSAYVTGQTLSPNFPVVKPLQATLGDLSGDAFLCKINADGSALAYSTFLGGSRMDAGRGIVLDSAGNIYLTGTTASSDFPLVSPFQRIPGGGPADAFVAKVASGGGSILYSTYLGGRSFDYGMAITVDSAGNAYVTGQTGSSDFPIVAPLQPGFGNTQNGPNAFVAELAPSGSSLVFSTWLGGSSGDGGAGIAVDSLGNVYVAGATFSDDFPLASPIGGSNKHGFGDAFILKIAPGTTPPSQFIYFPQVAVSGGYTTSFTFLNTGSTSARARLTLADQQGRPLPVQLPVTMFPNNNNGSSFLLSLSPGASVTIPAGPVCCDYQTVYAGWAQVEAIGGKIDGAAAFQLQTGTNLKSSAGVLASPPVTNATIPVDNDAGRARYTGFAVANPGNDSIGLTLTVLGSDGTLADVVNPAELNPLGPRKQIARFLHEILPNRSTFKGSLTISAQPGRSFVAVALVQNQGQFTAIPVLSSSASNSPR